MAIRHRQHPFGRRDFALAGPTRPARQTFRSGEPANLADSRWRAGPRLPLRLCKCDQPGPPPRHGVGHRLAFCLLKRREFLVLEYQVRRVGKQARLRLGVGCQRSRPVMIKSAQLNQSQRADAARLYEGHHLCPELVPGQMCFRVKIYNEGIFETVFHEHVPSHRISQERAREALRSLVATLFRMAGKLHPV
jgi:hypothetical protein